MDMLWRMVDMHKHADCLLKCVLFCPTMATKCSHFLARDPISSLCECILYSTRTSWGSHHPKGGSSGIDTTHL